MKRYVVFLTVKQIEELMRIAQESGMKLAEHIRRAVDEYIERYNKKDGDK